jgi:DnaJ family protein C protein 7
LSLCFRLSLSLASHVAPRLLVAGNGGAKQKVHDAKHKLKLSERKDYYKILGVEKTADSSTIKRAFRKLALKWHP